MSDLKFKKATIENLDEIRTLYWRLLDSSKKYAHILQWKKEIYPSDKDWITYINHEEMYLLYLNDELVGAVAITKSQPKEYQKIRWKILAKNDEVSVVHLLAISPNHQGKGLAIKAIDEIIKMATNSHKKAVRLDAISTNKPAQKLYEKYGFLNCGTEQEYYESTGVTNFIFYEYIIKDYRP